MPTCGAVAKVMEGLPAEPKFVTARLGTETIAPPEEPAWVIAKVLTGFVAVVCRDCMLHVSATDAEPFQIVPLRFSIGEEFTETTVETCSSIEITSHVLLLTVAELVATVPEPPKVCVCSAHRTVPPNTLATSLPDIGVNEVKLPIEPAMTKEPAAVVVTASDSAVLDVPWLEWFAPTAPTLINVAPSMQKFPAGAVIVVAVLVADRQTNA
jgi:hypothetical protein